MNIFWSEKDQRFRTAPQGKVATHRQIKDFFWRESMNKVVGERYDQFRELHIFFPYEEPDKK